MEHMISVSYNTREKCFIGLLAQFNRRYLGRGQNSLFHGLCCKSVADELLEQATNESNRAGLLASKAEGSGDWLDALSLQSVGLKLDIESVCVAAGLRLGAALVHPHRCVCEALVLADGHHGLACRKSVCQHSRHNQINDIVRFQVLRSSQLENHWASVRMESVRMASQRFHGKEATAWHGTPHAQIHLLHPTNKPRAF